MAGSRGLVKLFGRTIPVAPAEADAPAAPVEEGGSGGAEGGGGDNMRKEATEIQQQDQESPCSEEKAEQAEDPAGSEEHKLSSTDLETEAAEVAKPKEEQNNTSNLTEKTVKKPDKILPCPRCNSMDTKFCYYNNYNVNQPRHFCKNCQRYWTAGGTMRNVPVGAGRRKNKHSANHHRHITISDDTLQMGHPDFNRQVHSPMLKPNGTVLSFGSDAPFCESMASVLNLAGKTLHNSDRNGFHHPEELIAPSARGGGTQENVEEHSSGSSGTASNLTEHGCGTDLKEPTRQNCQGFPPPQVPCLNGTPWPSPWGVPSAFCVSSFPIPFYPPTAFWSCAIPGAWSVPLLTPLSSSPPNSGLSGSNPSTPNLGKHSREGDVLTHSNLKKGDALEQTSEERCLWIPKTLRIHDPEEAAKSSIWATMGIKIDKANGISRGELFKAFDQHKAEMRSHAAETSKVLHANPAALSRSFHFQESL